MRKNGIVFDCERMKYPYTGLYYYCLHLGKALLQHRQQPEQISLYLPPSVDADLFVVDVPVLRQDPAHKLFLPQARRYALWHCTYQGSNYFPSAKNLKTVLTVHDLNFLHDEEKPDHRKKAHLKSLAKKVERADAVVVISEFVKRELIENVAVDEGKLDVIYNGCTIDETVQPVAPSDAPAKPFLFTIGTIVAKKNFHVLPAALLNNDYELVIAGVVQDVDYKKKIIAKAEALGVAKRLRFIGTVTEAEKQWLLQNCSLFLFPSLAEGFGLPVIEAMFQGCAVLLSNRTSLPEVGGPHAAYLENFEDDYIAQKCKEVIADFSAQKSAASKEWAKRFNWQAAAEAHWKIYSQLLAE